MKWVRYTANTGNGRLSFHHCVLVANDAHKAESADHADDLLAKACLRERTAGRALVLRSDNG